MSYDTSNTCTVDRCVFSASHERQGRDSAEPCSIDHYNGVGQAYIVPNDDTAHPFTPMYVFTKYIYIK